MKLEMVQTTCPTAPGNYDIVSGGGASSPNNDMIGALFLNCATNANDANTNSMRFGFGATDLTTSIGIGQGGVNGGANAGIRSMFSSANCIFTPNGTGAQVDPVGAFGSSLAAGIRMTLSSSATARKLNTILISGGDSAMKVGAQYFAASDTSHVVTHGLGGTPDVIILMGSLDVASNTQEIDGKGFFLGFWDRTTGNMTCLAYHATTGAATTDNAAYVSSTKCGELIDATGAPGANGHVTITSAGGTNFTISVSGAGAPYNVQMGWIALRGTSAQMFSANSIATLPVGTGNTALVTGMGGKPQIYLAIPTRMTSVNTAVATDAAGSLGVSAGCTTDFSTTFQGANANTFKDGVATSVAAHQITQKGLIELLNTGAQDAAATVNSWDSGGVTLNYSAGAAGAFLCPVLAFGLPVSAGGSVGRNLLMGVG